MSIIDRIKNKMYISWNPWFRKNIVNPYHRMRLRNHDVSILCNNCVGAVIAHDLGLQFRSPFVNLWLSPKDYIKFCENIQYYLKCKLNFIVPESGYNYPVALLDDITIYFLHYDSGEEARTSWEKRKKRINFSNIRCLLVERDGCTKDDLIRFSNIPYPTASLVHKPMPEIKDTHYIRGFENDGQVGDTIPFRNNHYFGSRFFDDFDYVSFLNRKFI